MNFLGTSINVISIVLNGLKNKKNFKRHPLSLTILMVYSDQRTQKSIFCYSVSCCFYCNAEPLFFYIFSLGLEDQIQHLA